MDRIDVLTVKSKDYVVSMGCRAHGAGRSKVASSFLPTEHYIIILDTSVHSSPQADLLVTLAARGKVDT